jgi:hypothetical protein
MTPDMRVYAKKSQSEGNVILNEVKNLTVGAMSVVAWRGPVRPFAALRVTGAGVFGISAGPR